MVEVLFEWQVQDVVVCCDGGDPGAVVTTWDTWAGVSEQSELSSEYQESESRLRPVSQHETYFSVIQLFWGYVGEWKINLI